MCYVKLLFFPLERGMKGEYIPNRHIDDLANLQGLLA